MKFKLTRTRLAGSTEWTVEVERGLSNTDRARMSEGAEEKWRAVVAAIAAAPESAESIAREALD